MSSTINNPLFAKKNDQLECVHASVHVCIFIWIATSAPPNLHSCMQRCVPKCMSQSPLFWSHTLVRICTCINRYMHVDLTPHISYTLFALFHVNVWPPHVCPATPLVKSQVTIYLGMIEGDLGPWWSVLCLVNTAKGHVKSFFFFWKQK